MLHQHGIAIAIHLFFYFLLYPLWRKISLFTVGALILGQFFGIDLILLALMKGEFYFVSLGITLILCPLLITYMSRHMTLILGGKTYSGIRQFLLVFDTDLKYVISLFLLSLISNLYLLPSTEMLSLTNLTSVLAFLLSIPYCRKMNKLQEREQGKD